MKLKIFSLALCLGMVLASCNNMQKGAGIGAAGGAVLGGIIGNIAGNTVVGAAVGGAVGAGAGALIGKHMDKVKAEAEAVRNAEVQEVTDANGLQAVKLTFDSGILFATGKSTLSAASKTSLNQLATVLKNNTDCDVAIQGHTDNVGSESYNKKLSADRAEVVRKALEDAGIPMLEAEVTMIPQNYVELTDPDSVKQLQRILDLLEDDDDVQAVYHNANL